MKILVCGHRAYAARNFVRKLEKAGHEVWCFSRGGTAANGHVITGPVIEMDKNPFLGRLSVEVVVNFILLEDRSIDENIRYIDSICRWCEQVGVKRFVHISSISVLPNSTNLITEDTPIDDHPELKGVYGAVKIAIDNRLLQWELSSHIQVVLVRPGFITAKDKKDTLVGIAKVLPFRFAVLLGNSKSTLPIIDRNVFQSGLKNAIETDNPLKVYLLVQNGVNTKKDYLKTVIPNVKVLPLPKGLVISVTHFLKRIGIIDERKSKMTESLFKVQHFDAKKTSQKISD